MAQGRIGSACSTGALVEKKADDEGGVRNCGVQQPTRNQRIAHTQIDMQGISVCGKNRTVQQRVIAVSFLSTQKAVLLQRVEGAQDGASADTASLDEGGYRFAAGVLPVSIRQQSNCNSFRTGKQGRIANQTVWNDYVAFSHIFLSGSPTVLASGFCYFYWFSFCISSRSSGVK